MRIVSLLPSATEIVYALGLEDALVGVTHACDYPYAARQKPIVTKSFAEYSDLYEDELDDSIRCQCTYEPTIFSLDRVVELQPDLILVREACGVCTTPLMLLEHSADTHPVQDVRFIPQQDQAATTIAQSLGFTPQVLAFHQLSIADMLTAIRTIGDVAQVTERAHALQAELLSKIEHVRQAVASVLHRPRVAFLEWLDPLFGPGYWVPELVTMAGGMSGLGQAGCPAQRVGWGDMIAFAPEVIIIAVNGLSLDRVEDEVRRTLSYRTGWAALPAVRQGRVYLIDGSVDFRRMSPRIVDALHVLAEVIHPEQCAGWGASGAWRILQTEYTMASA
jgi:iron complex transport system substrate-binding protein